MPITTDVSGHNSWPTGPIRSGPMVGETSPADAFIWVQARDTSQLTLTVSGPDHFTQTATVSPEASRGLCATFHVTGLTTGITYSYSIHSHNGTTPSYQLKAAIPNNAQKARIAFGSCFHDYNGGSIFKSIVNGDPDAFVMCGDNCYYPDDIQDENAMLSYQLNNRNCDHIRPLIANRSTLGIWDDHDFGPNNSDSSYPDRSVSLEAFQLVWAQRSYGSTANDGIYSVVRCGPVDIFLTDDRFHRVERNHILGQSQLQWLKDKLSQSSAPVKMIVSGSVMLPGFIASMGWEGWRRDAPEELESLLSHIESNDIRGVVFASGDLHLGFVLREPGRTIDTERSGPDFWEVISSPLDNSPWPHTVPQDASAIADPTLIDEFANKNFGMLDVDLTRTGAEIELLLKDETGTTVAKHAVGLDSLRVRPLTLAPVVWNNGKAYFFKGTRYVRYTVDPAHEGVDPGYPLPIQGNWHGLFETTGFSSGIDAAVVWPTGKAYFFRGNAYVRYTMNPSTEGVDPGYPQYIASNWKGLWREGIDAGVVWPNGKAYFFRGKEYIRYTVEAPNEGTDEGYPKPIKGNWKGLAEAFPDGIDGVVVWPNGKAYFFKGKQYVRYTIDPANEGVDPGYPKPIAGNWYGLGQF